MTSFACRQPQQRFTLLIPPLFRPANFAEGGRGRVVPTNLVAGVAAVSAMSGAGGGFWEGGPGFEPALDPRGWWPSPVEALEVSASACCWV